MGIGFDFWNWIQNWKLDFFFGPRELSMMVSKQPDPWFHLCLEPELEPRFVKRKKEKKSRRLAGGILGSIYAWNQNCSNLLFTTELEVVQKSKELPNYTEKASVGQLPSLAG